MTNLDRVLKSRDIILPTKICIVKAMVFSSNHVQIWELDHKESQVLKNWHFWTVVLGEDSRVPWTARRANQSILKEINPEFLLKGQMLKLKLQYFGHLCKELIHWKRCWRLKAKGEGGSRGLNSITSLMDTNVSKLWDIVEDRGVCHTAVHSAANSQTRLSNQTTKHEKLLNSDAALSVSYILTH